MKCLLHRRPEMFWNFHAVRHSENLSINSIVRKSPTDAKGKSHMRPSICRTIAETYLFFVLRTLQVVTDLNIYIPLVSVRATGFYTTWLLFIHVSLGVAQDSQDKIDHSPVKRYTRVGILILTTLL